ncbi:hypothetical protein VNO77_39445 [Canavalia gladiata]|uniref:Disease resistance R13L4/SHOC-2-like LRR domain-containing protein n=1 Tax=Canavalia gladiata TaxID=3824 RepID=A0AAN9KB41_CANGL
MSIRTNPIQAVALLLKRLVTIEKYGYLEDLKSELVNIKDLFSIVKKNEEELLDTLTIVDGYLRNFNISKLMEEKEDICKRIRNSTQKLLPIGDPQSKIEVVESSDKNENMHLPLSLSQAKMLKLRYEQLPLIQKRCLSSLFLFPENAVIKKMHVIYWWFGMGFLDRTQIQIAEKQGIEIFNLLEECELIVPNNNAKCPNVNRFKINHWFDHKLPKYDHACEIYSQIRTSSNYKDARHDCLVLDQKQVKLNDQDVGFKSTHWKAIFNIGASYLNFGPQWMSKMKNLEVLHLGRWQDSASHHIEVESEEFLKEIRNQKYLKYLSLRGISRISKIPPFIFQLESLEFLDLKACHNLETIPNDIASLRNLNHLNVSECYLLESMPKGIEKLTKLKVLKGYVIGSSGNSPCRISDLENLKKLKRLSIHIRSEAMIQDKEFTSFANLSKLRCLKISWGVSITKFNDIQIILPIGLEKLHLEGFPGDRIPTLRRPIITKHLRMYITGGKLKTLDDIEHEEHFPGRDYVKVLCLKYLKHLQIDLPNLLKLFPSLTYVEIKQIQNHSYIEWSDVEERD